MHRFICLIDDEILDENIIAVYNAAVTGPQAVNGASL
jgi:hypothetical protein